MTAKKGKGGTKSLQELTAGGEKNVVPGHLSVTELINKILCPFCHDALNHNTSIMAFNYSVNNVHMICKKYYSKPGKQQKDLSLDIICNCDIMYFTIKQGMSFIHRKSTQFLTIWWCSL